MIENKIIDGKKIASKIKQEIKTETVDLKSNLKITPGLAFILVGNNPSSEIYVNSKSKTCDEVGFFSVTEKLPDNVTKEEIIQLIDSFNKNEKIHGILVQLPLPVHINELEIIEAIDYKKDVDGFHPENIGRLILGDKCFLPCTPYGITELLKRSNIETRGKNTVIIGRSNIVGKPMSNILIQKQFNCTVSVCHSLTKNIEDYTLNADLIIVAIGKPNYLKSEMIKKDCVVIDVGINRIEDAMSKRGYKIVGDVDFNDCFEKCGKITPVPGGVGPMTIAMLIKNTLESAKGNIY